MARLAGDHAHVLVDGYELTADSNRISVADMRDMYDVTSFQDGVHKYIPGRRGMVLEHTGFFNVDDGHSHPVLKSSALTGVVSVLLGQNALPVVGDPTFSLSMLQGRYSVAPPLGSYIPFVARFANRGMMGGWGVALTPPVEITGSTTGTAVDGGAATQNGGAAFMHLMEAAATDRYTFTIQGSTTGAFAGEETTLAVFDVDGSAVGSERVAIAGSIPRYVRWQAQRSGLAAEVIKVMVCLVRF